MKLNILNYKHVLAIAFMGLAVCISSCKDDEEGITGFRLDKEPERGVHSRHTSQCSRHDRPLGKGIPRE